MHIGSGCRLAALVLPLALVALPLQAARAPSPETGYRNDEVLVRYREHAQAPAAKSMRDGYGLQVKHRLARGRIELLSLPSVLPLEDALDLLSADPTVEGAEPNFLRRKLARSAPNDPLFHEQWGLHATGQANFASNDPALASIPGADMDLLRAWDRDGDGSFERTGNGTVAVAIIDDAFDLEHPDLAANFVAGRDLAGDDANPRPDSDQQGHGTQVAGALGAIGDNGIGVAGVAWNVQLLPLKIGRDKLLSSAAILAAYDWIDDNALARGIRVVNASYGGPTYSQLEYNALARLRDRGILFVAAAGNEDSNTDRAVRSYPANYDLDNIVAVAASNRQDDVASFSQYGPLSVDLAAPGLQIVTTRHASQHGTSIANSYTFNTVNRSLSGTTGTSFASPYVAGIAALIAMEHPTAGYREIKARLMGGAERSGSDGPTGAMTRSGRANAANSLDLPPQPVLALKAAQVDDAASGNGRLDPGETADLRVIVENLWRDASDVLMTLSSASSRVQILQDEAIVAFLPGGSTHPARFTVRVDPSAQAYEDVRFDLRLRAQDGYEVTRSFALEIAALNNGQRVNGLLSTGLYDEFHTYHFELPAVPAGHRRLRFLSTADRDIDLLVKRGSAPEYLITLAVNPDGDQIFSENADQVGGDAGGNEVVCYADPLPGTYFVTVVNYAQFANTPYTLEAVTDEGTSCPRPRSRDDGNGGGGGAFGSGGLLALLALAALRRRTSSRRCQSLLKTRA